MRYFPYSSRARAAVRVLKRICSYIVNTSVYIAEMSTQVRSGGGGGGRTKSKAGNKENKENAGSSGGTVDGDQQQQQQQQQAQQPQQPLQQQQKGGNATNNSGGSGGEKPQKKGTDNNTSGSKGGQDKQHQQQTTTHTIKTKQPTAEQIRIAQITDIKSGMDDPKIQEKIQKLMETTQRSEEEVCCALQECDNDLDRAVIFLLETLPVGAFATTSKKKKNKSQNKEQNEAAPGDGDWDNVGASAGSGSGGGGGGLNSNDSKDRRGPRSGGPGQRLAGGPGGAGSGGRGGRGSFRDGDRGGDRNGFDRGARGPRGPPRDGRDNGPGRGSYGGGSRGGRGGGPRVGTRGPGMRDQNRGPRLNDHQEIDAWDPVSTSNANDLSKPEESSAFTETWGDWDNEEYTGSLSDTKVFTASTQAAGSTQQPQQQQQQQATSQLPSTQSQQQQQQSQPQQQQPAVVTQPVAAVSSSVTNPTELSAPPGLEQQILNPPQPKETDLVQQYSTTVVSSTATAAAAASNTVQYPELHSTPSAAQHLRQALEIPQINSSSSLSAEQSQYFNTLSSQNSNLQSSVVNSYQPSTVQYPTTYGSSSSYSDQVTGSSQQAPAVRRQRARVPPPSKIPSSAVEMPGDSLNSIGYLDVQFGGLDFGTDDSFDTVSTVTDKFNTSSLDQNTTSSVQLPSAVQPTQQPEVSDYQSKPSSVVVNNLQPKSNLTSSLQSTQILPGQSDSLSASQNDSLSSSYSQRNASTVVPSSVSAGVNVNSINSTTSTLEQLTKTDPYSQSTGTNAGSGGYQNVSYSTSQANKTSSYPSSAAPQGYNNSSYSSTQVSTNTYPASSNNYSSYNQTGVNSYQQPSSNVSSSVVPNNNSSSSVGVSTVNQSSPNLPVNNNNVSNNSSNTNTGYLSSQYPVSQTSSAFPSQQSYQNSSQNVYGNTGLNSNTGYSGSTSTSSGQYSNFSSSKLKDTPVSTQFESVASSTVSNNQNNNSANNNNSVSSSSSSLPNSSVVSTTTKSGSGGTGSSSGTGAGGVVPNIPMVSPYIQPGVPFYQQPVYSYEELQMIQQRMSHVPGYYDMNYQTPTSLGAAGVRDANLGSVAYSTMSDGRFTRTDNNSSPVSNVPSTMSQQTGSGGPMLNLPYAYFYGGNVMPSGFQYGTPAIYPQQMATNATSGGQFQKPAYNSGYGTSGYDTLSQTGGQDYNKNPYPSSGGVGQQSKGQTVSNPQSAGGSGSDIAPSMYGKSHVALNKVNSYEKQSFHSGTPPPYNIAGTQTAGATSGQPYGQHLYIPTIPTHHNINMHQAMHQDSNSSGQRPQSNSQGKTATKQGYSPSTYWTAQN